MFSRGEGGEVGWGTDVAVGSPVFFNALVGKPCLFQISVSWATGNFQFDREKTL